MGDPSDFKRAYDAGHSAVKRLPRWVVPAVAVVAIIAFKLIMRLAH